MAIPGEDIMQSRVIRKKILMARDIENCGYSMVLNSSLLRFVTEIIFQIVRKSFKLLFMSFMFFFSFIVIAQATEETRTLVLGVRSDAPPFSSCTDQNAGNCQGYSVSLCEHIAKRAISEGIACDYRLVKVSASNRFEFLQHGAIDMLCGASTVTLERMRVADFSLFTFLSGMSVMYNGFAGEFKGVVPIGVLKDTTTEAGIDKIWDDIRTELGYRDHGYNLVNFETHYEGIKSLKEGKIKAYIADREILLALRKTIAKQKPELLVSKRYFTHEPYAIGLQLGNTDLRFVADSVLSELFDRNLAKDGEMGIISILKEHFPDSKFSKPLVDMFANQHLIPGNSIAGPIKKIDCSPRK
jgi:polar amino acid transport system substrate-binding protein/glutamate/aspartate transport system substrate-binding protein